MDSSNEKMKKLIQEKSTSPQSITLPDINAIHYEETISDSDEEIEFESVSVVPENKVKKIDLDIKEVKQFLIDNIYDILSII